MNPALIKQLKDMQNGMMAAQKEIEETAFKASAGGVVSIEMYGTKEIAQISVSKDFSADSAEDYEMLSDMIVAACNQAYKEIERFTSEKMKKYEALAKGKGLFF